MKRLINETWTSRDSLIVVTDNPIEAISEMLNFFEEKKMSISVEMLTQTDSVAF